MEIFSLLDLQCGYNSAAASSSVSFQTMWPNIFKLLSSIPSAMYLKLCCFKLVV